MYDFTFPFHKSLIILSRVFFSIYNTIHFGHCTSSHLSKVLLGQLERIIEHETFNGSEGSAELPLILQMGNPRPRTQGQSCVRTDSATVLFPRETECAMMVTRVGSGVKPSGFESCLYH